MPIRFVLASELLKLKKSKLWLIMMCIPLICIVLGLLNFQANKEVLVHHGENEWIKAWTQVGMLYSMFLLPILIGIYSSLICRSEFAGNNWNKLLSMPISIKNIYISKLIMIAFLSFITQIFLLAAYTLIGKLMGLPGFIPFTIIKWVFHGWIGTIAIASLQLLLSTSMKSFSVPVGVGVGFTFLGILLYLLKIGYIWPLSYPAIAMDPINLKGLDNGFHLFLFYLASTFYICTFSFIGIWRMEKRDV
jgi:lantibiotic transport system permease protein